MRGRVLGSKVCCCAPECVGFRVKGLRFPAGCCGRGHAHGRGGAADLSLMELRAWSSCDMESYVSKKDEGGQRLGSGPADREVCGVPRCLTGKEWKARSVISSFERMPSGTRCSTVWPTSTSNTTLHTPSTQGCLLPLLLAFTRTTGLGSDMLLPGHTARH